MPIDLLALVTWTTRDRESRLDHESAEYLRSLLPLLARKAGADLLELAVTPTHVHAVVSLGARFDAPRLAQELKGASSRLINQRTPGKSPLRWAAGYDLRSIGRRNLPAVCAYLDRQAEHHRMPLLLRWSATRAVR